MTCLDDAIEACVFLSVKEHCKPLGLTDTIEESAALFRAVSALNNRFGHFTRDEAIKVGTDFADRYAARLIEKARQK